MVSANIIVNNLNSIFVNILRCSFIKISYPSPQFRPFCKVEQYLKLFKFLSVPALHRCKTKYKKVFLLKLRLIDDLSVFQNKNR